MAFNLESLSMSLDQLQEQADKDSTEKKNYKDDRFWNPTRDDSGNATAIIRFLPPPAGEQVPWVKYWNFGFKGPTGLWYFENCLKTLDKEDPVLEYNRTAWADQSGGEEDQKARQNGVKNRKARLNYVFNIYVVKDKNNPANNGKVFLYRAGSTIYSIIKDAMKGNPDLEKDGIPVFDFLKGANFNMDIYTEGKGGYKFPKYDRCSFATPSPLLKGSAKELEKVYNQLHSLQAFVADDQFKDYSELKTKLYRVLALDVDGKPSIGEGSGAAYQSSDDEDGSEEEEGGDAMDFFRNLDDSE